MTGILQQYLPLVVFIGVAGLIGLALLIAPFLLAFQQPDPEKLSAYECGFNAFDDARMKFDVRFYLVAILFIIFDLEVAFLFPWAVAFGKLGATGFWSMLVFLAVLTVGFAYECGFNAFDDARMKFDVRFYLVAILFIIFDLEVAFLFPWAVAFGKLGATGFWSMMVFLAVLTVGFAYEWKKGALEWD